jgi:hypothetical protein
LGLTSLAKIHRDEENAVRASQPVNV